MKVIAAFFTTLLVVGSFPHSSVAETTAKDDQPIGRYQMTVSFDGTIYVLDTSTGQCWSKLVHGRWRDEGSPSRLEEGDAAFQKKLDQKRTREPLSLELPQEKVQLAIKQRLSKPIPGSHDRIFVHLDDITGGQVLISVRNENGKVLLDDVSASQGDVVEFRVGEKSYFCRIKELKNFLVGQDFAIVEIASSRDALQDSQRRRSVNRAD